MNRKTILVLLDACRFDSMTENAGFLEHMIEYNKGAKYRVKGEIPSLSRPIYETIFTGLPVSEHGVTSNFHSRMSCCENVFSLCIKNEMTTAAAAHFWLSELYNCYPYHPFHDRFYWRGDGAIDHGIFYSDDHYPDNYLYGDGEFLRRGYQPDFLVYHSMEIDYYGHKFGAHSKEYESAVSHVTEILAALMPRWLAEDYNVVITSSYGINDYGMHGGDTDEQRIVPLYVFSPKCKSGRFTDESISQLAVAPLLCHLLGIEAGEKMIPIEKTGIHIE